MSKTIQLKGTEKSIGGEDVFVIAEIGKNFIQSEDERSIGEYLNNAKNLVDEAVHAGADAVKFQTHEIEDEQININITSPHFRGSDRYSWIKRNTNATPLDEFWIPLKEHCKSRGVIFFSTPMSRKGAQKINEVGTPLWKVGSGDVQDYLLLDYILETKKPIIISSGMVSLSELDEVIQYILSHGSPLAVLYCVSQYPAPAEYFNLGTIEFLKEKYPDIVIGFSDHSLGSEIALVAVRLGAQIVEKHFSLSRDFWGADHKVSMLPDEFREMVKKIRKRGEQGEDTLAYYGIKNKELDGAQNKFRPYFNKSLMAGRDITAGEAFNKDMVFAMRPKMYAKGIASNRVEDVIGRKAEKSLNKYDPITWEALEDEG